MSDSQKPKPQLKPTVTFNYQNNANSVPVQQNINSFPIQSNSNSFPYQQQVNSFPQQQINSFPQQQKLVPSNNFEFQVEQQNCYAQLEPLEFGYGGEEFIRLLNNK